VDGTLQDTSIFLPINTKGPDTNLAAVLNAKMKPAERAKLNQTLKEFMGSKVEKTVFDDDKFNEVAKGIEEALKGYYTGDEDATKTVKDILVRAGYPSSAEVTVTKGILNDVVKIDGKNVSIGAIRGMNEESKADLKELVYNKAKAKFSKKASDVKQAATPRAGDVMDGYKFKGGDPSDQKNWEQVK
jgi:hypothetical protein